MNKRICRLLMAGLLCLGLGLPAYATDTVPETTETVPETCSHVFGEWEAGEKTHSRKCTICGETQKEKHEWEKSRTIEPGCSLSGSTATSCSVCLAEKTEELPALGHDWSPWSADGEGIHTRSCTRCGETEQGEHTMTTEIKEATCKASGSEVSTCDTCGYTVKKTLPISKEHSFGDWEVNQEKHKHTCTVCGEEETGRHNLDEGAITSPATCKDVGILTYTCQDCGGTFAQMLPKEDHTYGEELFSDETNHWKECTACGHKDKVTAHKPGAEATEEREQLCTKCGYVIAPKLDHVHRYGTEWTSDMTGHWHSCSGCGQKKDMAAHVFDAACDPDCDICGYTTSAVHIYDGKLELNASGHWGICKVCHKPGEVEPHTPDPEADPNEQRICTACGYVISPAQEAHTHDRALAWKSDEASHWRVCSCGQNIDEALHTWDDGRVVADGTTVRRCIVCGTQQTVGEPEEETSSPFRGIIIGIISVICIGAVGALLLILQPWKRSGRFVRKDGQSAPIAPEPVTGMREFDPNSDTLIELREDTQLALDDELALSEEEPADPIM